MLAQHQERSVLHCPQHGDDIIFLEEKVLKFYDSQFSALANFNIMLGPVVHSHRAGLNFPNNKHGVLVDDLPEDAVLTIEPIGGTAGDEELTAI